LETFLKGKELWGHIDGSSKRGSTGERSLTARKLGMPKIIKHILDSWFYKATSYYLYVLIGLQMLCGIISSKSITMTKMLGVSSLSWPLLTILRGIYQLKTTTLVFLFLKMIIPTLLQPWSL